MFRPRGLRSAAMLIAGDVFGTVHEVQRDPTRCRIREFTLFTRAGSQSRRGNASCAARVP